MVDPIEPTTLDSIAFYEPPKLSWFARAYNALFTRTVTWDLATQYPGGQYNGSFLFGNIEYSLNLFGRYWAVKFVRVTRGGQYHVVQSSRLPTNRDAAAWTNGNTTFINPQFQFSKNKALCGMVICHEKCHTVKGGHHAQDGGLMGPNGGYNLNPNDYPYFNYDWAGPLRPTDEPSYMRNYLSSGLAIGSQDGSEKLPLLKACRYH
jgi:hypothetical protein